MIAAEDVTVPAEMIREGAREMASCAEQADLKNLPAQPFTYEWACLKACPKKRWRLPYAELGFVERIIPVVFAVGYIVLAVRAGMGDLEAVIG